MERLEPILPAGFEELEHLAPAWALPTSQERFAKRVSSRMGELKAYYELVHPRAEEALALLDQQPLAELREPERRLMYLLLALVDVSLAIEVYGEPRLPLAPDPDRYSITMRKMVFH